MICSEAEIDFIGAIGGLVGIFVLVLRGVFAFICIGSYLLTEEGQTWFVIGLCSILFAGQGGTWIEANCSLVVI